MTQLTEILPIPLPLVGLLVFLAVVVCIGLSNVRIIFLDWHGIQHRVAGAVHLGLLIYGALSVKNHTERQITSCVYDVVLGISGTWTTWTASRDFPHRYVSNANGQSGTLSEGAMVTQNEMREHLFYEFLNLWQACYLHGLYHMLEHQHDGIEARLSLLCLTTAPWTVRQHFPVHSFSDNWTKDSGKMRNGLENAMYRAKKWQYVFYKHFVLHGLNISACVTGNVRFIHSQEWRIFWISLNTAYVMEFFLQSLVKRRVLNNVTMLFLNRWLMLVSSLAALQAIVLSDPPIIRVSVCLASLVLNFGNRHHDLANTMFVAAIYTFVNFL